MVKLITLAAIAAGAAGAVCEAKKIVWVPFPGSISHHMLAAKVGQELAARGHEFIVVNTDYDGKQMARVNTEGITELLYEHPTGEEKMIAWLEEIADLDPFTGTSKMVDMVVGGCTNLLEDASIIDQIKDADVLVVDAAVCCGSVVRDYLKIPIRVDFLPITFYDPFYTPRLGSNNKLSSVPQMGSKLDPNMDFGARVANTIVWAVDKLVELLISDPGANGLRQKYGLEGSHKDAMADTGIMITQNTWVTEFPRAIAPAIKMVGPILASDAKPLADDDEGVKAFVEAADKVLVVSFGSQARVSQDVVDKMAESFGMLNIQVLWKTPGIEPKTVPSNVLTTKWFPQNDLLGHANVVAFLSHGGLNSVSEAAYHGVPVIGFPLFGDQWDNIARLEYQDMAEKVDANTFTAAELKETVERVVADPTYAKNARKVSAVIKDSPKKPVELAADWVEYAIRHDGALFNKVPGLDQPYFVSEGYDVMFFFIFILWLIRKVVQKICCGSSAEPKDKKE